MKKIQSICENYEFRRVYKRGKSSADSCLAVYYFKNYKKENRLGITVSNKIGKAVVRNKIKRRIKNAFYSFDIKKGYDIVVVSRTKAAYVDFKQIKKSLNYNFKKLGVLNEKNIT